MEKLIRSNVPLGPDAKTRRAEPHELDGLLGRKLVEEAAELAAVLAIAPSTEFPTDDIARRRALVEECADVIEVVNTILHRHGVGSATLAMKLHQKHEQRGGFTNLVLITDE